MIHLINDNHDIFEQSRLEAAKRILSIKNNQSFSFSDKKLRDKYFQAKAENHKKLINLHKQFNLDDNYLSYIERLGLQSGNNYYKYVFRDWVWGQSENEIQFQLLKEAFPLSWGNTLMAGAGAGGLGARIIESHQSTLLTLLDFDPVLTTIASKMFEGDLLTLTEFPDDPISSEDIFIKHKMKESKVAPEQRRFIVGDFFSLNDKYETLLMPWFIDVNGASIKQTLSKANQLLDAGGNLLHIGPLNFATDRIFFDQISDFLYESGFELQFSKIHQIDYLNTPYSTGGRKEKVLVFYAKKTREEEFKSQSSANLDLFLNSPIENTPIIHSKKLSYQFYAQILQHINGKVTGEDLSQWVCSTYGLSLPEARISLLNFFRPLK